MQAEKRIFTVTKWNAVASWVSDSVLLNCSICKESLEQICNHCILLSDPNITCPLAKGQCGHSFHKHCLDRWFSNQKNQNCLLCSGTWNPALSYQGRRGRRDGMYGGMIWNGIQMDMFYFILFVGVCVWMGINCVQKEAPDYNPNLSYQMNQKTSFPQQQVFHLAYDTNQLNKSMISFNQQQLLTLQHIIQGKQMKEDAAGKGECSVQPIRNNKQTEKIEEVDQNAKQDKKITDKEKIATEIKRKLSDLMTEIDLLDIPDIQKTQNKLNPLRVALISNRGVLGF